MSKIWITSDTHFGHTNISGPKQSQWKSGFRDFNSVEEMNKTLVETINKYVGEEDILYHLGDWSFSGIQNIWNFRKQLRCKTIHLCLGNHDEHIRHSKTCPNAGLSKWDGIVDIDSQDAILPIGVQSLFTSTQDTLTVKHGHHTFFMSHYSHRVWLGSHKGYIHLYGHSHDTILDYGKSMDVGVDVAYRMFGEYRPFSIEEIISIIDKKQIEMPDHHSKNTNVR